MKLFGLGSKLHGNTCIGFVVVKTDGKKKYFVKFSSGEKFSLKEVEDFLLDNNE